MPVARNLQRWLMEEGEWPDPNAPADPPPADPAPPPADPAPPAP